MLILQAGDGCLKLNSGGKPRSLYPNRVGHHSHHPAVDLPPRGFKLTPDITKVWWWGGGVAGLKRAGLSTSEL